MKKNLFWVSYTEIGPDVVERAACCTVVSLERLKGGETSLCGTKKQHGFR